MDLYTASLRGKLSQLWSKGCGRSEHMQSCICKTCRVTIIGQHIWQQYTYGILLDQNNPMCTTYRGRMTWPMEQHDPMYSLCNIALVYHIQCHAQWAYISSHIAVHHQECHPSSHCVKESHCYWYILIWLAAFLTDMSHCHTNLSLSTTLIYRTISWLFDFWYCFVIQ